MENNNFDEMSLASSPYIIVVKQFTGGAREVPPANTKAYAYPKNGSSVVYTFPQPTSTKFYYINSVVYCDGNYWLAIPNLPTSNSSAITVTGYVKCSDVSNSYISYANPDKQTPNSTIGTNKEVIFNMWYFPTSEYKGVNYATPLYYQYYYVNGQRKNSEKCTLFASISGLYRTKGIDSNPTDYMNSMTNSYWLPTGLSQWLASMSRTTGQITIRQKAKTNLDAGKPFIVGAQDKYGTNHMVLVAGYKNSGSSLSDYLVLDSCEKNFSSLDVFFDNYPNYPGWDIGGTGYVYGEF